MEGDKNAMKAMMAMMAMKVLPGTTTFCAQPHSMFYHVLYNANTLHLCNYHTYAELQNASQKM